MGIDLPRFKGMNRQSDPGAIDDGEFWLLENVRLDGTGISARPGLAVGINTGSAGCVLGIWDERNPTVPIAWDAGYSNGAIIADDTQQYFYWIETSISGTTRYFRVLRFARPVSGEPNIIIRNGGASTFYGIGTTSLTESAAISLASGTQLGDPLTYAAAASEYQNHYALRANNGTLYFCVTGFSNVYFYKFVVATSTFTLELTRSFAGLSAPIGMFKLGAQLYVSLRDKKIINYPENTTTINFPNTPGGNALNQFAIETNGNVERNVVVLGANAYFVAGSSIDSRDGMVKFDGAAATFVEYVDGTIPSYISVNTTATLGTNGSFVFCFLRTIANVDALVARFDGAVFTSEGVLPVAQNRTTSLYDPSGTRLYRVTGTATEAKRSNVNDVTVMTDIGAANISNGGPLKFVP